MSESAGIIYAEIAMKIDELKKGGKDATEYIEKLSTELKKQGESAGKEYVKGFGKGQQELNQKLNDFASTMQNISPKMGALGDKIAKMFAKPIFSMIPVLSTAFQAMLPVIGAIIAAVAAITAGLVKGIKSWKEQTDRINGSRKAAEQLNGTYKENVKSVNDQVSVWDKLRVALEPAVSAVASFGKWIGEGAKKLFLFLTPLDEILDNIQNIQAGFATLGVIIAGGAGGLKDLISGEKKLGDIYKEQLEIIKEKGRESAEARILADEIKEVSAAYGAYEQKLDEIATARKHEIMTAKQAEEAKLAAVEEYIGALIKQRELAEDKAADSRLVKDIDNRLKLLKEERDQLKKTAGEEKAQINLLEQATKQYQATLAQVQAQERAGFITSAEAQEKRLAAENQYITAISALKNEYASLENVTEEQIEKIRELEAAHIASAAALKVQIEYHKTITALSGEQEKSAEILKDLTAGHSSEYQKQLGLIENQRKALAEEIEQRYEGLRLQRESKALTEEEAGQREKLLRAADDGAAMKAKIEWQKELNREHGEYVKSSQGLDAELKKINQDNRENFVLALDTLEEHEKELEILELRRACALEELQARYDALEAQRGIEGLTEDEIEEREKLTAAINRNFDALKAGIRETKEEAKGNFWKMVFGDNADAVLATGAAVLEAYQSVTDAMIEITMAKAQELIDDIDRRLEEAQEEIERQREEALEAAGFIEAQKSEQLEDDIARAKESGDQILQYYLERRQEEMRINEEFDAKAKAAEKKAAQEKAKIEYDAAKAKHALDITNAILTGAQAVMNAIASGWSVISPAAPALAATFGALAGASMGAQLSVLLANPPKPPKFETGGIVPGNSWSGDKVPALVNSGELILNKAQQDSVAGQLSGGGTYITVVMMMDSVEVARSSAEVYGSGQVLIPVRGINGL
jgi:hypothetical protein